jgi:hypothetical protein
MALIELCDGHRATAKDRRALAALVDKLPEAHDTAAVARARALLDKTKSGRPTPLPFLALLACRCDAALPKDRKSNGTKKSI